MHYSLQFIQNITAVRQDIAPVVNSTLIFRKSMLRQLAITFSNTLSTKDHLRRLDLLKQGVTIVRSLSTKPAVQCGSKELLLYCYPYVLYMLELSN